MGTRAVAKLDRNSDLTQAAVFYEHGLNAFRSGDLKNAIHDLREATIHDRDNQTYSLALSSALFRAGQDDEALHLLVQIRENNPEGPEINTQLARLEARRGDIDSAKRYYHHALYGIWQGANADQQRRDIRLEFIKFLADHNEHDAAMSELLALRAEAPKEPAIQDQMGELALRLNDPKDAKSMFEESLRTDRRNIASLTGLAEADYRSGEYRSAERAVQQASAETATLPPELSRLRDSLQWMAQNSPVARGLSRTERFERLSRIVSQALQRASSCSAANPNAPNRGSLLDASNQLVAFQARLNPLSDVSLQDQFQDAFSLIAHAEDQAAKVCGAPSAADDALTVLSKAQVMGER